MNVTQKAALGTLALDGCCTACEVAARCAHAMAVADAAVCVLAPVTALGATLALEACAEKLQDPLDKGNKMNLLRANGVRCIGIVAGVICISLSGGMVCLIAAGTVAVFGGALAILKATMTTHRYCSEREQGISLALSHQHEKLMTFLNKCVQLSCDDFERELERFFVEKERLAMENVCKLPSSTKAEHIDTMIERTVQEMDDNRQILEDIRFTIHTLRTKRFQTMYEQRKQDAIEMMRNKSM